MNSVLCAWVTILLLLLGGQAQAQMDLSQVSGQPLPSADVPAGTMTIRVVRGALTNNVGSQPVEVTVDGSVRTVTTDQSGRAQVTGLKPGARVKAATVVDGERVVSQEFTVGSSGIRLMLVAGIVRGSESGVRGPAGPPDSGLPDSGPSAPAAPPIKGSVAFGPESRVVAEFTDDRLSLYYLLEIVNPTQTPIDPGGPVIVDLPREARGATVMQDSSRQATVSGARVAVLGPFAPGSTPVRVAFELPAASGTARVVSRLSAALPHLIVIVGQIGGLDLVSPQISAKREVTDEGQRILVGTGPAIAAGQAMTFDITGLPHHATWPRNVALALAAAILTAGLWAAVAVGPRRRRA